MSKKYFSALNYTLGNEDSTVEIEMVKILKPKHVFSICGSGGRALPLLAEETLSLTLSDLSKEQLNLAGLRLSTYKELNYDDFLKFWGYFPYRHNDNADFRKKTFLNLELNYDIKSFFEKIFFENEYQSVLYSGKWEKTFQLLAKINQKILGADFDKIMRFDNLADQIHYYRTAFPIQKWKLVLFILGNKSLFNALLYKGDFIEKNSKLSHFEYYYKAFERLFTNDLAKNSFFLQLCFYGKIQSIEGVPVEATRDTHTNIKNSTTKIHYINQNFVNLLADGTTHYDFLSLSDVPSYFKDELEHNFMQNIRPSLSVGAIIVIRYYLRISEVNLAGFIDVTNDYLHLIKLEKVQVYDIRVYKYVP